MKEKNITEQAEREGRASEGGQETPLRRGLFSRGLMEMRLTEVRERALWRCNYGKSIPGGANSECKVLSRACAW